MQNIDNVFEIERKFTFYGEGRPSAIETNTAKDSIYFINGGVYRMSVNDKDLPSTPFIESRGTEYCAIGICPSNPEIYVADAIDWQQKGLIYRYSLSGELLDSFRAGINPSSFCWY